MASRRYLVRWRVSDTIVWKKLLSFAALWPGKRLFGAVVYARYSETEQLQGNTCHYLVVTRRVRREADFGARDVVMIVKNADATLATIAVRSKIVIPGTRHRKIIGGRGETFGDVGEGRANLCDIERGH